jgi:hypothetical protein
MVEPRLFRLDNIVLRFLRRNENQSIQPLLNRLFGYSTPLRKHTKDNRRMQQERNTKERSLSCFAGRISEVMMPMYSFVSDENRADEEGGPGEGAAGEP